MPYKVEYKPVKSGKNWAKINKDTGKIVSRHRSKKKAQASIRAYYATRNLSLIANVRRNPLQKDPTRTLMIRKRFVSETRKRMRHLRGHIRKFMVELDALGLKDRSNRNPFNNAAVANQEFRNVRFREYEFQTNPQKLESFREWLSAQVDADILSPSPGGTPGEPWTAPYVESAYRRGMVNSWIETRQSELALETVGDQTRESFIRSAFAQPERVSKVQLLATRSFNQMRGLGEAVKSDMNRILAQGMADGKGAIQIANEMTAKTASLTEKRALVIARTETIYAHAEGQLDAFDDLGVEELGVKAEWSTAGDDRVCPRCLALEGRKFTMDEARGKIPLHPNCRCAWIPYVEEALKK